MAYFNGQASSYQELLQVLTDACVDQGYVWQDGILSKNKIFIKPFVSTQITSTQGLGLLLQGGTGKQGVNLIDPSPEQPRMGRMGAADKSSEVIFPCMYEIFIFDDPEEVYLIVNFSIDCFYYLAFGISKILLQGTGLWITGTMASFYQPSTNSNSQGWSIGDSTGGVVNFVHSSGPFWRTVNLTSAFNRHECIHTGFNSQGWQAPTASTTTAQGAFNAICSIVPLISRLPSAWSSESVLLPIQITNFVSASKTVHVADIKNARYLRIDSLEPKQIIQIGSDKWKVFPFFRKNSSERNGGIGVAHTGTYGWAIRYDGP